MAQTVDFTHFHYYFFAACPPGKKTLRGYRDPLALKTFDRLDWSFSDLGLEAVADERSLQAALLGANP